MESGSKNVRGHFELLVLSLLQNKPSPEGTVRIESCSRKKLKRKNFTPMEFGIILELYRRFYLTLKTRM
ncbi:MAG: hypothetical protein J6Y30_12540 [Treponema sp.]|nr:hypothetical protein [Treponema sp.]